MLTLVVGAGLLWWLVQVPEEGGRDRKAFPAEVPLENVVCYNAERGGLFEASSIAVFALDAGVAGRLQRDGSSFFNRETPPPNGDLDGKKRQHSREWIWTPWMPVGLDGDALVPGDRATAESGGSRARMFVVLADEFTGKQCREVVAALDWNGAMVRFQHPASWTIDDCDDSCLAQVLFPSSRLAISATYD
ncbi:MAG: hypothetical protein JNK47_03590 [Mesorhizobium sp.]|nr:hypothetical protein [Mesorhizobium sp.]MBL8576285.1 hypothetical protein [Mesorhizobium sp.]